MDFIIKFTGILIGFALAKRVYREIRFRILNSRFFAKWSALSMMEKEEWLYAMKGLELRESDDDYRSTTREYDVDPTQNVALSYLAGSQIEYSNKIIKNCPDYSSLNLAGMNEAFWSILNKHWHAMKVMGDYDFFGAEAELQLIFDKRQELSNFMKSHLEPGKHAFTATEKKLNK